MNIKEKIKNTKLFTNLEKIEILVNFEKLSSEAQQQLEKVIDEYDESLKEIKSQFKTEITEEINKIKQIQTDPNTTAALDKMQQGYNKIF